MPPKGKRNKIIPNEPLADEAPVKKTRVEPVVTPNLQEDEADVEQPTMTEEDRKAENFVEAREEELFKQGDNLSGEDLQKFLQKNFLDFDVDDF